jgi:O-antigen ligase
MSSSIAGRFGFAADRAPLVTLLFFLTPFLTAVSPRFSPFMLLFLSAAIIGRAIRRGIGWRELIEPNPALLALTAFVLYALLSALWAANPQAAVFSSALFLVATLLAVACLTALAKLQAHEVERAARAFLAGSLCGAVFVLIELLTNGMFARSTMNWISAFRPDRFKHMRVSGEFVKRINISEFNQNVAILAFQLWAGLLALFALERGRRLAILAFLYFFTLAIPIAVSRHDSSQVGIVLGLAVLALAWKWPRQVVNGLAAIWCLGFVLVLPLDFLAYRAELHQADWLPSSARARIIIWEYTAERVLERPVLGIGADSTARRRDPRVAPPQRPKGFVYQRTTGAHAHNAFLQTWYELGLVGAILFAIAGAAVAFRILLLPRGAQPFAAATFVTFAAVASFAWSIWQVWLVSALALVPIYLGLAAAAYRNRPSEPVSHEESPAARCRGTQAR